MFSGEARLPDMVVRLNVWFAMRIAVALSLVVVCTSWTAFAQPKAAANPLERAESLIQEGRLDEAVAQLEQVSAKEPRRFLLRAEVYRLKKDFNKAQEELQKVLTMQPNLAQVRAERGAILLELGKRDEAAAELRRAVADKPDLEDEWYNLGQVELQLGRCKEAVAAFETATARKPKDASNWVERARAELKCDKPDAALASARRAAQLPNPEANTFFVLGLIAEKAKKPDDAVEAYKRAEKLDAKNAAIPWALGVLELNRDHVGPSIPPLQRAVDLDPAAPKLADLGRAKALFGETEAAQRLLEQALQKNPKYVPARVLLGRVFVQKKQCADLGKLLTPLDADAKHKAIADKLRAECKAR